VEFFERPIAISLKDTGCRRVGFAVIDIDRIEFSGYREGAIGSDGFIKGRMALNDG